jgi:signal transduction histidine kinase
VKFTGTGGKVSVEYGCFEQSAPGELSPSSRVYFRVSDNGIGIAADQLERIFEPFMQADSGYTRRQGGTGLGLSISRSLAHLMKGTVSVESTPGAGSCFTLALPMAPSSAPAPAAAAVTSRH